MLTWQTLQDLDEVGHALLGAGGQGDNLGSGSALCVSPLRKLVNNWRCHWLV